MERITVPFDIGTWKGQAEVTCSASGEWAVVGLSAGPRRDDGIYGSPMGFEAMDAMSHDDMLNLGAMIDAAVSRHALLADTDSWTCGSCPGRGIAHG